MKRKRILRAFSMLLICILLISSMLVSNTDNVNAAISTQKRGLISTLYGALGNADETTRLQILQLIIGAEKDINTSPLRMKTINPDNDDAKNLAIAINAKLGVSKIDQTTLTTAIKDFYNFQQENPSEAGIVLKQFKEGLSITDDKLDGGDGDFPTIINGIEANTSEYLLFLNFVQEVKDIYNLVKDRPANSQFNPLYEGSGVDSGKVKVYKDLLDLSDIAAYFTDDRVSNYKTRLLNLLDKLNGNDYNHENQRPAFIDNLSAHNLIDLTYQSRDTGPQPPQPPQPPGPTLPPAGPTPPPTGTTLTLNSSGEALISTEPELDNKTGEALATITDKNLEDALNMAKPNDDGVKGIIVDINKVVGASAYAVEFPSKYLASSAKDTVMTIQTDIGSVTVPNNMLTAAEIGTAQKVELSIGKADINSLSGSLKQQIGNKPVIDINVSLDGKPYAWKSDTVSVKITYKYSPTAEELKDPEHIVVWYITDSGEVVSVPNGRYNLQTGEVEFSVNHLSKYAIAYVKKSFIDTDKYPWAVRQINVMASKGIINGTAPGRFEPAANITRGDYIHLLINTLGLNAKADSNFDDVSTGSYYYSTIGIAKKLGIATGVGSNKLDPKAYITRQDMMTLTARALKIAKKLDINADKTVLSKFKDKNKLAGYAQDSAATMVKYGIIAGNGIEIMPLGNTTRAEAAVIMYRIYNK